MRRIDAPLLFFGAILAENLVLSHRAGQTTEIPLNEPLHRDEADGILAKLRLSRVPLGTEQGALRKSRLLDVLRDGFGSGEVKPDASMLIAFFVQRNRGFVAVLV